jgi:hypothetical protein
MASRCLFSGPEAEQQRQIQVMRSSITHSLNESASLYEKSLAASPGEVSPPQMACHFPSLPIYTRILNGSVAKKCGDLVE